MEQSTIILANEEEYMMKTNSAMKIQKIFRGYNLRRKRLPLIMYKIKKYLKSKRFQFSRQTDCGRINSSIDEDRVIKLLIEKFGNRIEKSKVKMWNDILAYDYMYGWIPINIKTIKITPKSSPCNVGNLALCVYCYTDETLDLRKKYNNGDMSEILIDKIKNKEFNYKGHEKDYFFLVLNKLDPSDIIVNSVKGLSILKPNLNNLPFQVCWDTNRTFKYQNINKIIEKFIHCLQKPEPTWYELFLSNARKLEL
jgi:hypothetical protein